MLNQQQPPPHFTQGPPPNMMHHSDNQLSNNHDTNPFAMNQPPPNHQMWNSNISQSNAVVVPATPTNTNNSLAINITAQIEAINMQQNSLREQIRQSESNLTAQHTVNLLFDLNSFKYFAPKTFTLSLYLTKKLG